MNTQGGNEMKFDPSTIMFLVGLAAVVAGLVLYLRTESIEYKRLADNVNALLNANKTLTDNWNNAVAACQTVVAESAEQKRLLDEQKQRIEKLEFAIVSGTKMTGTLNLVATTPIKHDVRVLKKMVIQKPTVTNGATKPLTDDAAKKQVIKKIKKQMQQLSQ